jgi:hypothetical protein
MSKKKFNPAEDAITMIQHYAEGGTQATLLQTVLSQHRYKNALRHIRKATESSEATEIKEVPVEPPVVAEDKPAKPGKAEKTKPPMLTKVPVVRMKLKKDVVYRYILTAAQDSTPIFAEFWESLLSYAHYMNAPIFVAGLTYQKGLYEDHAVATATYDKVLEKFMVYDRIQFTDDLLLISDANVLPTTANPLAGWQTANRGGHVVIPSTRIALESIPRMQDQPPRYAISTGCITRPSYTPRAAGRKALFHHTYGALLIEIDLDGEVFFHHLCADEDGSFQHLDVIVDGNKITLNNRVRSVVWGDIHHEQLDPQIALSTWGYSTTEKRVVTDECLQTWLKPEYEFFEDTLDFRRRNHHDIHDPHSRAKVHSKTNGNVEDEVREAAAFINAVARDGTFTTVVESNHDAAIARWLKNPDGMFDAENAYYWHLLNSVWHRQIRANNDDFNVVHEALRLAGLGDHIDFVGAGESRVIDGVEHGLHGDIGIGGTRGSPTQYRRFGVRTSTAHTHSPCILDGAFVAGVAARLFQGYNRGPTRWAHAHIIQYLNSKRALVLMSADGRFQAMGDRVWAQELEAA